MLVMQVVGNSCIELEELKLVILHSTVFHIQPPQGFKSLKTLKLCVVSCENFQCMSALTNLRELHLLYCGLPKDSNQFAFLTQLTKLHIHRPYGTDSIDVVEVIRQLINLEELTLNELLDQETFSKIVAIVKKRPNVLTLRCFDLKFNLKKYGENQKVRLLSW